MATVLVRGDVVLVPFPFTDLSSTRLRPAVVLWTAPGQDDFTLAFLSTQNVAALAPGEITLLPAHPEFALTGLTTPSKLRAMKLVTLSRTLMRRRLGRLGPLLLADLDRALVTALGIGVAGYQEEGRRAERDRLRALLEAGGVDAVTTDLWLP